MKEVPSNEIGEPRKVEPKRSAYIDGTALGEEKKLDSLRDLLAVLQQ